MKSDAINELATALAKAQAKITGAVKNASNPHFKSAYANLQAVWDAIREPLSSNGLAVIQTTTTSERGLELVTTLVHSSGQWIEGRFPIVAVRNDPQGIGSATSYARRFSLAALVGVYQTDDDAELSKRSVPKITATKPATAQVKVPEKAKFDSNFSGQF